MNRRRFLGRMLCGGALFAPGMGQAARSFSCVLPQAGGRRCQIGFPAAPQIAAQPCQADCWANAIAYVLRGFGADIGVGEVFARLGRAAACRPGQDRALIQSAAGLWQDRQGRRFYLRVDPLPDLAPGMGGADLAPLVEALTRTPLIVGTPGHSRVLTEMRYSEGPGAADGDQLVLRDPWAGSPNRQTLALTALPAPFFALRLGVRAG